MKLVEIDVKEFEDFAYKHEQFSFHQTKEWASLKKNNGWSSLYLAYKDKEKILGACLILRKSTPLKKEMWYSPRGYLIDYKDKKLLKEFTDSLKEYAKNNKALFIKIDPYIIYKQRDINGNLVDNGIDNSIIIDNLKELGYKHYGFSISTSKELQPRWIYVLDIEGKSQDEVYNNFSNDTKRYINRCMQSGLITEEIDVDRLDDFKKIMEHTSARRGFIDRPISYYKEMLETLGKHIKIINCYMDTSIAIDNVKKELDELALEKTKIEEKLKENPDSKKSKTAIRVVNDKIASVEKKQKEIKELEDEHGKKILMAGSMFIIYPREVVYLYSGSFDKFMKYNPQYLIQWEIIKYTIKNKIKRYNFYGIDGNFNKENNEMYGVYEFKKGFDGNVEELVGEFDLVIDNIGYKLYNTLFGLYRGVKRIINKIKSCK